MSTFGDKLKAAKKNLKASSIETYLRNIRRLRKVHGELPIPAKESKWLTSKNLLAWYDKQTLSVRRHMATAASVAMGVYKKESEEWKKRQHKSMKEFDEERRERKLTDKQKAKIPSKGFDALKGVISTMKKELRHVLAKKYDEWSMSDLLRVQDLIIISLYYDFPLRLDYATLNLGKRDDGNSIFKNMSKPRGWHITLKEYKTAKSLGNKTIKPNTANQRLLNKFIPALKHLTTHNYLLTNQNKGKMSKQVLSKRLMAITKRRIGKDFSVQLLRILFAMKNRGVLESAKEVSQKLLHSQEQSLQYAKKS
jgi:hypothetical protein